MDDIKRMLINTGELDLQWLGSYMSIYNTRNMNFVPCSVANVFGGTQNVLPVLFSEVSPKGARKATSTNLS